MVPKGLDSRHYQLIRPSYPWLCPAAGLAQLPVPAIELNLVPLIFVCRMFLRSRNQQTNLNQKAVSRIKLSSRFLLFKGFSKIATVSLKLLVAPAHQGPATFSRSSTFRRLAARCKSAVVSTWWKTQHHLFILAKGITKCHETISKYTTLRNLAETEKIGKGKAERSDLFARQGF